MLKLRYDSTSSVVWSGRKVGKRVTRCDTYDRVKREDDRSDYDEKSRASGWEKDRKGNALCSFIISWENFWITPTWWRKTIDGDCRSANFDELFKLQKGKAKRREQGCLFQYINRRELLIYIIFFLNGKATNSEIRLVAKLKLVHNTILEFRAD